MYEEEYKFTFCESSSSCCQKNAIMYAIAFAWLVRNHVIIVRLLWYSLLYPPEWVSVTLYLIFPRKAIYPSASPRRWKRATTNRCIFGNCRTIHQGWVFNLGFDVGIIGLSCPAFAGCGKSDRPQVFEARWAIVFSVHSYCRVYMHRCQAKYGLR